MSFEQEFPKADVIFLIDASPSMRSIIGKLTIALDSIYQSLLQSNFRLRLKVIAYNWKYFWVSEFTENVREVKEKLNKIIEIIEKGKDIYEEFTLPALDFALDSDWVNDRRVIILLTDECLKRNHDYEFQVEEEKWNKLIEKIDKLFIRLVYVGLDCEGNKDYNSFLEEIPRSFSVKVEKKMFQKISVDDITTLVVETVSTTQKASQSIPNIEKDIYKLSDKINIRRL